jgi:hypothetical protein
MAADLGLSYDAMPRFYERIPELFPDLSEISLAAALRAVGCLSLWVGLLAIDAATDRIAEDTEAPEQTHNEEEGWLDTA